MGKIVMPKNSAMLNEVESVLKIYYEADGWMHNDLYKKRLKELIGDGQYSSSYTKKAQITSYFGFTTWKDFSNPRSERKITESGKRIYLAIENNDYDSIFEELMLSLEKVKFGRENFGVPESDSDIEPPSVFIRAILDLDYLTYKEFAYILWKLEDQGRNYTDIIKEIKVSRSKNELTLPEEALKYTDAKPISILLRWNFFAEKENIQGSKKIIINPIVLGKYRKRLLNLKIYNIDMDENLEGNLEGEISVNEIKHNYSERLVGGRNILLYGIPGSGKSYTIENEFCKDEDRIERLVFHPDYTYSDFIGQILPSVSDGNVKYEFTSGPFTRILKKAFDNPKDEFYLILEELNRGNAPAIFGEVFQLLDRNKDGMSEYGVSNSDISKIVYGNPDRKVKIPSNLYILGTMNTSDQNVFTLDTAFQRRWNMRMIENDMNEVDKRFADHKILDSEISWRQFNTIINNIILEKNIRMTSSEDKRLGVYFISESDLKYNPEEINDRASEKIRAIASNENSRFAEKVLKYLWDDAFKFSREDVFETKEHKSLESLVKKFKSLNGNERFLIFKEEIYNAFLASE